MAAAGWLAAAASTAQAHAFDERHDLPVPLGYFIAGAVLAVGLSFVVVAVFAWISRNRPAKAPRSLVIATGTLFPMLRKIFQPLSVVVYFLILVAAFRGTANPMMNLAPSAVWIAWWVGGSMVAAFIGNVWPALDPWRALFDALGYLGRRAGCKALLNRPWPQKLSAWPAVALLLLWGACEVIYPLAAVPSRLGYAAVLWTGITLSGMFWFGRKTWQQNGDVFAIYFEILGRFAPLSLATDGKTLVIRPPGNRLVESVPASMAIVAFILAMLAIVLFDGILAGEAWASLEQTLRGQFSGVMDANGYFAGSMGLLLVWLVFLFAYLAACGMAAAIFGRRASVTTVARVIAPALVPIAVAYAVAHNFSALVIQGQNLIPLLSDPLGAGWDILGTADHRINGTLIQPGTTWTVALCAIITGHLMSVWLAHRASLNLCHDTRTAILACMPLTALMMAYTAISLQIIAEPMVRFIP